MTKYCQLTYEQRCQIKILFQANFSVRDIAKALFVSPSTISRELKRNRGRRGYRHKQAQSKAFSRRKLRSKSYKMSQKNIAFIKQKLTEDQWSPEQISGYLKRENMEQISHKTIYSYIWKDKANGGKLYLHLRHHRKKRKQYGKACKRVVIKDRISIDSRPEAANRKVRVGDCEVDTIIGKDHKGAIVSIVDRKSKLTFLAKILRKTAQNVSDVIIGFLRKIKTFVHTITSDNGTEFALHKAICQALDAQFYFADPYASWQRGLNENTNGLVRQYVPKGSSFKSLTDDDIFTIMCKLNSRPRKSLGFKTPAQVFFEETGVVIG